MEKNKEIKDKIKTNEIEQRKCFIGKVLVT